MVEQKIKYRTCLVYVSSAILNRFVKARMTDGAKRYYVFLDEIQFVSEVPNPYVDDPDGKITFIDVVLGLMKLPNADIYVTGSNSKMLSSDILTQFRDRGDEIRVNPRFPSMTRKRRNRRSPR